MRIGTRLLVAGISTMAALTLATGTASAATAPAAATSHQAVATSGITATPASTGFWKRNYAMFQTQSQCQVVGSSLMYSVVDGGVVTNYDCVSNGVGGWELDLFISPLNCSNAIGRPGAAEPAAKCA